MLLTECRGRRDTCGTIQDVALIGKSSPHRRASREPEEVEARRRAVSEWPREPRPQTAFAPSSCRNGHSLSQPCLQRACARVTEKCPGRNAREQRWHRETPRPLMARGSVEKPIAQPSHRMEILYEPDRHSHIRVQCPPARHPVGEVAAEAPLLPGVDGGDASTWRGCRNTRASTSTSRRRFRSYSARSTPGRTRRRSARLSSTTSGTRSTASGTIGNCGSSSRTRSAWARKRS